MGNKSKKYINKKDNNGKKSINKKDNNRSRLRCRICNSFRHMKEQCKDKQEEDNRKNLNGDVLRCSSCDSVKHLLSKCPHSWENMAEFGEEGSSDDESVMTADEERKLIGGFGWNYAILDTGCNKSVAGMRWTEEYIRRLSSEDRKKVK